VEATPIVSSLGKWWQENPEFKTSPGYVERPCLKDKMRGREANQVFKPHLSLTLNKHSYFWRTDLPLKF
jgi:hypothetical protein